MGSAVCKDESVQNNENSQTNFVGPRGKKRLTLRQAAITIQCWIRGVHTRILFRRNVARMRQDAIINREKVLRGLGGYSIRHGKWQRFLPVSGASTRIPKSSLPSSVTSLSAVTHPPEPDWVSRYNLPDSANTKRYIYILYIFCHGRSHDLNLSHLYLVRNWRV